MTKTLTIADPSTLNSSSLLLRGIRWETYHALVKDLEPEPSKRLTYDQGVLEIMVPLPPHEQYKSRLGRIVEVTTEEAAIEIASLGSTTWNREDLSKGLEPDECYYIQNESQITGQSKIDLTIAPPPDLAIEIDITRKSLDRLPIYAAFGVPEVWRFDGQELHIYSLTNGEYCLQETSRVLPLLNRSDILRFLVSSNTQGETSWIREFRRWVRLKLEMMANS
jgi:Uma2 family endonuclease